MAYPQGLCEYGGYSTIIGGDYTESRGVQPGVFRLRMGVEPAFAKHVGPLVLRYDSNVMSFADCATAPHIQRVYQGRQPYCWSVKVYDKRWKWRYPRISGHYNTTRCDGTRDPSTEKLLSELLGMLLDALGETSQVLRNIPLVHPQVDWENAYAARELEWLCDWAGLVICPQRNGAILIEGLGDGASLPSRDDNISPSFSYSQTVMPSKVQIRSSPTVFQSRITLEAVGLDTDGAIRLIDNLSYKPTVGGWSRQWYTLFSGVDPGDRHLAFQTVWRWYRLKEQADGTGGVTLDDMRKLKILEKLAETHPDDLGVGRCVDAVVQGAFWPLSDHKANTDDVTRYSGPFRVIPDLSLIAFEYPVIKWDNTGLPAAADLTLYVAYHAKDNSGAYLNETIEEAVTQSIAATEPRIEKRRYLKRVKQFSSPYTQGTDNLAEIQAEARAYATSIVKTYGGGAERDMLYGGLIPLELSGRIAQIRWRWGNDRVATTRASENHEFDTSQQSHQARRRAERLGQLFDHVMES